MTNRQVQIHMHEALKTFDGITDLLMRCTLVYVYLMMSILLYLLLTMLIF